MLSVARRLSTEGGIWCRSPGTLWQRRFVPSSHCAATTLAPSSTVRGRGGFADPLQHIGGFAAVRLLVPRGLAVPCGVLFEVAAEEALAAARGTAKCHVLTG